jgi:hypothetical protein
VKRKIALALESALFCAAWLAGIPAAVAQPGASTAQGTASAQIAEPVSVVAVSDLSFGAVAVSASEGGAVTVAPASGAVQYSGQARPACSGAAQCAIGAARFAVTGESGRDYAITLPAGVTAHNRARAASGLPVSDLTAWSRNLGTLGPVGRLDQAGADEVRVGGKLAIPAGTAEGIYVAELKIVVMYS